MKQFYSSQAAREKHTEKAFEVMPSYGYMKAYHQLLEDGFSVSSNAILACHHRKFHETLKYITPMSVYFDSLKINDEITLNLVNM